MSKIDLVLSSASMPYSISIDKKIENAKGKGFDGIELLLTRRNLRNLEKRETMESIYSLHQPFREGGNLMDRLVFLDWKPFPKSWSYEDFSHYELPTVIHTNDYHFKTFIGFEGSVIEFNTFQTDHKKIEP